MKKITYEENTITKDANGKETESKKFRNIKIEAEPDYIKLYTKDLCLLNDIPKTGNRVLNELLNCAGYDNLIILNPYIRAKIVKELNINKATLNNSISKLKKEDIIQSVGRGTYKLNPNLFGKGKWQDIKELRIEWTYNSKGRTQTDLKTKEYEQTEMDFQNEVA